MIRTNNKVDKADVFFEKIKGHIYAIQMALVEEHVNNLNIYIEADGYFTFNNSSDEAERINFACLPNGGILKWVNGKDGKLNIASGETEGRYEF